ncbi:WASH complex subunit CCDC53, partial [Lamprotornis superbus]
VPAIQQKRTVAFLNQFVVHTVQFLNRFSTVCEEKLSALSLRIQQIETTLNILDAKLSSIPGLEDVKFEVSSANVNSVTNGPMAQAATDQQTVESPQSGQNNTQEEGLQKTEVVTENVTTVAKDPRYARYLKMVQVGVPVMAIRNKMISEGLNPDLLESEGGPLPGSTKGRFPSLREAKTGAEAGGKAGAELVSSNTAPQTMQEESRQGPDTGPRLNWKSRSQACVGCSRKRSRPFHGVFSVCVLRLSEALEV